MPPVGETLPALHGSHPRRRRHALSSAAASRTSSARGREPHRRALRRVLERHVLPPRAGTELQRQLSTEVLRSARGGQPDAGARSARTIDSRGESRIALRLLAVDRVVGLQVVAPRSGRADRRGHARPQRGGASAAPPPARRRPPGRERRETRRASTGSWRRAWGVGKSDVTRLAVEVGTGDPEGQGCSRFWSSASVTPSLRSAWTRRHAEADARPRRESRLRPPAAPSGSGAAPCAARHGSAGGSRAAPPNRGYPPLRVALHAGPPTIAARVYARLPGLPCRGAAVAECRAAARAPPR